jgi:curved DNA-binding protein CbpA
MTSPVDPYTELGVSRDATPAEIARAFRRLLRRHHPDTRPAATSADEATTAQADAKLQRILDAYSVLRHADQRAAPPGQGECAPDPTRTVPIGTDQVRTDPIRTTAREQSFVSREPPIRATPVRWRPSRP